MLLTLSIKQIYEKFRALDLLLEINKSLRSFWTGYEKTVTDYTSNSPADDSGRSEVNLNKNFIKINCCLFSPAFV